MNKKDVGFVLQVDFKEQTPDVLLKTEKPDPLYEKAFLSGEDKSKTDRVWFLCNRISDIGNAASHVVAV